MDGLTKERFFSKKDMDQRASELRSQGWKTEDCEDPERGMLGVFAHTDKHDGRIILEFPVYGSPLNVSKKLIRSKDELKSAFNDHHSHESLRTFRDPIEKAIGLICHCLGNQGISLVFSVPLKTLDGISPETLKEFFPNG
jgi:hypothetical protein